MRETTLIAGVMSAGILLAACAEQATAPPPAATPEPASARIERTENICPLVRFLVDGKPAEQSGFSVQEAMAAARQSFHALGLELVVFDRALDRFQKQRIYTDINLNSAGDGTRAGSSTELAEDVRKSIRDSAMRSLRETGGAERANCAWVLTGQVDVSRPQPDPQSRYQVATVRSYLTVVEAFTDRSVGDAYNPGRVREPDVNLAIAAGMAQGLESNAATIADHIRGARKLWTIVIHQEPMSGLVRREVQKALEDAGFKVRSSVDGPSERQLDAELDLAPTQAEDALVDALLKLRGNPRFSTLDYTIQDRLVTIAAPPS